MIVEKRHIKDAATIVVNNKKTMCMIEKWEKGRLCPFPSILEALDICPKAAERISVAGAGGKTSLIKCLVSEYSSLNIPAVVTTTTHMYAEKKPYFVLEPTQEKIEEVLQKEGKIFLGKKTDNGKMQMPDEKWMDLLMGWKCPVLIEADGARHMPLKVPGENEPVFCRGTGRILYVYGMDAVGRPLGEVCFRAKDAAHMLKKEVYEPVFPQDIARLAMEANGAKKGVNKGIPFTLILNKTDLPGKRETAQKICKILKELGYEHTILCLGNMHHLEEKETIQIYEDINKRSW